MTPIRDTDYLAVSARLHAMETRLLTPEKRERYWKRQARQKPASCWQSAAMPRTFRWKRRCAGGGKACIGSFPPQCRSQG